MRGANVSIGEAVNDALDARDQRLNKTLPGTVLSYDAASRTATVKPGVNRLVPSVSNPDDDELEELPAIPNVPVCWPVGRGFRIDPVVGLLPGDPVLLLCCDRDISGWLHTGQASDPDDARTHSWGSAVAIPGLVHTNYANTPVDAAALASRVLSELTALASTVSSLVTKFNSHTHAVAGAVAGAITSAPPGPAGTPSSPTSVASNILKVDS